LFSVWQCFLIYVSVRPFPLLYLLHPASYLSLPSPSEVCVKYAYSTLVSSVYQSLPSVFHCLFMCFFLCCSLKYLGMPTASVWIRDLDLSA
jgi:hypothetical protein